MTSRSWRCDAVGQRGGVGRGLPEVPVDGELVVGVALRAAAHRLPLRQDPHQQVPLVEGLQDREGGPAGEQEVGEQAPGALRPGVRERRRLGGQAIEGRAVDAGVVLGRGDRDPQHEDGDQRRVGVGRRGAPRRRAGPRRGRAGGPTGPADRSARPGTTRCAPRPRRAIQATVRAARATSAIRASALGVAERLGDPVLFLQDAGGHWVGRCGGGARPAPRAGRRPPSARASGSPCPAGAGPPRTSRRAWTSRRPPRPSFRSGSSRKATSPCWRWRALHRLGHLGQPALGPLPPQGERLGGQVLGERGVAGQMADRRAARWPCRGRRPRG